jgi:hypothetical protein
MVRSGSSDDDEALFSGPRVYFFTSVMVKLDVTSGLGVEVCLEQKETNPKGREVEQAKTKKNK